MASLILYIDGSDNESGRKKHRDIGWALVALHEGQMVERAGAYCLPGKMAGCHELVAFFEAMRYAKQAGFAPEEVAVYTDDAIIGYAGAWFHPENYAVSRAENTITRLKSVSDALFTEEDLELSLSYLKKARFHKLKSHRFCVYNNRVDYLARALARNAPIMSYCEWLKSGITYYTAPNVSQVWHPPFSLAESLVAA